MTGDFFLRNLDGLRALQVVQEASEDFPPELREGIVRRRLLAAGQPCPCGAKPATLNRQQRRAIEARKRRGQPGQVMHITVTHEDDCPATDDNMDAVAAAHGLTVQRLM